MEHEHLVKCEDVDQLEDSHDEGDAVDVVVDKDDQGLDDHRKSDDEVLTVEHSCGSLEPGGESL